MSDFTAGDKPVSLKDTLSHAHKRIDILVTLCEAVVMEEVPAKKAKLLGMLAIISRTPDDVVADGS